MNLEKLLKSVGVPAEQHSQAMSSFAHAKNNAKGLLLHKAKVRYLKSKQMAQSMVWENERYVDVNLDGIDWDIAPMINITAHGDNSPWVETPKGGVPVPNVWLNKDPNSEEYKYAVSQNYWCPGEHPRSYLSVKSQFKRNGGEGKAWRLGEPVDVVNHTVSTWTDGNTTVMNCGKAWLIKGKFKLFGFIPMRFRKGFEIDNVYNNGQAWFPIEGYDLRAPVTWSTMPNFGNKKP